MIPILLVLFAQIPVPPPPPPVPSITPQLKPDAGAPTPPVQALVPALFGGLTQERLAKIQAALQRQKLDGWLFYDFRHSDAIADRVLGLDTDAPRSRAWYCLIPARGDPRKLLHAIEPHSLDGVPGPTAHYASWRTRDRELALMLRGYHKVAMNYSPRSAIFTVSRVDGGTIELVRSLGPEVVSSAELVAEISSVLSPTELASQARAAELLEGDLEATAQEAVRRIRNGNPATERELQDFVLARWKQEGLDAGGGRPGVAVDAHSADPHYSAPETGSAVAAQNSFLLLDFAAHLPPSGIYGDLTRVYFLGEQVPSEITRIANIVFQARDAAISFVRQGVQSGKLPTGAEVDDVARSVIIKAGYGDQILHRTGHNIGIRGHGDGVNNDDFETHDSRHHLPDTCFSIEPGIYLTGRFGVRSEIDGCITGGKLELRPSGMQSAVPAIH
jgi:Xaa-Pro aminopeptidase